VPQPTYDAAFLRTVSPALTQIAVAWQQAQDRFAASAIFPQVDVGVQAGSYITYRKGDWFRTDAAVRAPGTETAGSGWNEAFDTYFAKPYGVHKDIDGFTRQNAQAVGRQPDRDAARFVANQLLLRREADFVAKFFTTGVWTGALTGQSGAPTWPQFYQFNDYTNSDPLATVARAKLEMEQLTGLSPNVLVCGPQVRLQIANHPKVINRIQYTQRAILTDELLAALFEVDKFLVPKAIANTANEGAAADSFSFTWGKSMLLAYATDAPSTEEPTAGATFTWSGYLGVGATGTRVRRYRIEEKDVDRVEAEMAYDMKIVAADCGSFFATAVA